MPLCRFISLYVWMLCFSLSSVYSMSDIATYPELYQSGKQAYTDERWYECLAFMKRAIEDYKYFRSTLLSCRKKCLIQVSLDPFEILTKQLYNPQTQPVEDISKDEITIVNTKTKVKERKFWERLSQRSLCLVRCRHDRLTVRKNLRINNVVETEFEAFKPYSYMQICYYKMNDLEHAVSAAYTFLIQNPGDNLMSQNLEYYSKQLGFKESMMKNLEEREYQRLYLDGIAAYEEGDYQLAIDKLELVVEKFLEAEGECRLQCESAVEHSCAKDERGAGLGSGTPVSPQARKYIQSSAETEFYLTVVDQYASVLRCRTDCTSKLSRVRGNFYEDFVPSNFNYLQFSYWKSSNVRKACEAVATFLAFYPDDESMLFNKEFYQMSHAVTEEDFVPRMEIMAYYQRHLHDVQLLNYLDTKFKFEHDDFTPEHPDDYRSLNEKKPSLILLPDYEDPETFSMRNPIQVHHSSDSGTVRKKKGDPGTFNQADQVKPTIKQQSVKSKTHIPDVAFPPGAVNYDSDSAMANWRPSKESLLRLMKRGVTVTKKEFDLSGSFRFVAENVLSEEECRMLTELSKNFSMLGDGYDGKQSPHTGNEFFSGLEFTKVVQLAADGRIPLDLAKLFLDKSEAARDVIETYFNLTTHLYFDYTHLVCREPKPGLQQFRKDLSHPVHADNCVLKDGRCVKVPPAFTWRDYSDFDGGEFIFTDTQKNIQTEIKPKCGLMIAFVGETPHGVKAVLKGTRCVLAQWMTLDQSHQETARIAAQQRLAELEMLSVQTE